MKCELCHKADAAVAIHRGEGDDAEELYVCSACASAEKMRRKKKNMRTRKEGASSEVSITVSGGEAPPPFLAALMDAVHGMVSDLEKAEAEKDRKSSDKAEMHDFPCGRISRAYRFGGGLHLEGLHLIGELDAVRRAVSALKMELVPFDADGVKATGHVFRLRYKDNAERAKRVVGDMLREEHNARMRLAGEMSRVFADAICRALAVLKNCRLLSPGELFDLLSPLRLGAMTGLVEGIDVSTIETMAGEIDLSSAEDHLDQHDRDRLDAERADEMNRRFEDVVIGDAADGEERQ